MYGIKAGSRHQVLGIGFRVKHRRKLLAANRIQLTSRKAVALWISWVLIIGFAIALSMMVFTWIVDLTKSSTKEMRRTVYDTADCDYVSVRINSVCQAPQALYINITNNKNLVVNGLIFRVLDVHNNPEVKEKNLTLKPEVSKFIQLLKQGTTQKLEVIPVIHKEEFIIVCRNKIAAAEAIAEC